VYSHLLVAAVQQRDAYERKEPALASEFLHHLKDTHDAAHEICARYVTFVEREFAHIPDNYPPDATEKERKSKYGAIEIKREFLAQARTEAAYMEPIIHHYADWYAQIEPWMFLRERPIQLAAKLFLIVQEFNSSHDISFCAMIGARHLAELADRKSASAIKDEYVTALIIETARDPDLLLYPYGRRYSYAVSKKS
jgi:hypothetical protein